MNTENGIQGSFNIWDVTLKVLKREEEAGPFPAIDPGPGATYFAISLVVSIEVSLGP